MSNGFNTLTQHQIRVGINRLMKNYLIQLEDIKQYINYDDYRKIVLDNGNDTIRELCDFVDRLKITGLQDKDE